jgi:hypothetical protein
VSRDTFDRFTPPERGRFGENEAGSERVVKSNLVDLDLYLRNDNPDKKAIAVSLEPDAKFDAWAWLPRSRIEYETKAIVRSTKVVSVTLPEPLAKEKGLI